MKRVQELTEKEFNRLKDSGLLNVIYPELPKDYSHVDKNAIVPLLKEEMDWHRVIDMAKEYIDNINKNKGSLEDEDFKQYLYETVMRTVYGKNVFDWINKNSR